MTEEEGWILDCYPSKDLDGTNNDEEEERAGGMTFWLKTRSGGAVKLRDKNWHARIFASGSACDDVDYLLSRAQAKWLVRSTKIAYKVDDVYKQKEKRPVLEIELREEDRGRKLAELLESAFPNPASFSLYNVDVLPEQQYFYDKELFPLAFVRVETSRGGEIINWQLEDSVESTNYRTPPLRVLGLDVEISDPVPTMASKLKGIALTPLDNYGGESRVELDGSEQGILSETVDEIKRLDPDILVTRNGDAFVFPFLYSKAEKHSVDLKLNRDEAIESYVRNTTQAKVYFSYGKIMYRPATQRLYGRLHLDEENTFIYDQCRLQGLFEVSRLCRMPFHTSMRASIGKCLSSLQFYYASKKDVLIPWKPRIAEDFKSGHNLLLADRGGLVLEPLPGAFERIGELDFSSLYPSIIRKFNISVETVNCKCCGSDNNTPSRRRGDDGSKNSFEDLDIHICRREKGIVADSLNLPLDKRFEYRRLRDGTKDETLKRLYNERAGSLKWILVCCFGYLSYRNAKFGKIDSHIAVCAKARETLLDAMHLSEYRGFEVVHGIVDSLWLSKKNAGKESYKELCDEIRETTGFNISLEGIYKWIVFLPSKTYPQNQVANRYFGCFEETNELKTRGIEVRRHDTPSYFRECQNEILQEFAKCDFVSEVREVAQTKAIEIFNDYAKRLEDHGVSALDLVIRRRLSKELEEYTSKRHLSVDAAKKLEKSGLKLRAGQSVSYVITKHDSPGSNRSEPEELVRGEYDSKRYVELLADCAATVLSPFGVTKEILLSRSRPLTI